MIEIEPTSRIAIVGSRDYPDLNCVSDFVKKLKEDYGTEITIVSGGARGVDSAAANEAVMQGLAISIWRPDWNQGKKAGMRRNYKIVNDADWVVSFWTGDIEHSGSAHTIKIAKERDKLWKVFGPDGQEIDHDDLDI